MVDSVKPHVTNVLIVEDEFLTIHRLKLVLNNMGFNVIGDAMSAKEAIAILEQQKVDLALLDINIKGNQNGIWLGQYIADNYQIPFIYLTAYSQNEIMGQAIKTKPYAYLTKPFNEAEVFASITLAVDNFNETKHNNETNKNEHLIIKHNQQLVKLAFTEIDFFETYDNYLKISVGTNSYLYRKTLKEIIAQLPSNHFVQTHRGYVVNMLNVTRMNNNVLIVNGHSIPISRKYKKQVNTLFTQINNLA